MINVCNNTGTDITDIPTVILLGIHGQYWFWPSWARTLDYEVMDYEMGLTSFYAVEPFIWPTVNESINGIEFYAALLNQEMNAIMGDLCYVTFSYTDM